MQPQAIRSGSHEVEMALGARQLPLAAALRLAALAAALATAGCETVGGFNQPSAKVAEVDTDQGGAATNLASLSELIERNPQDPSAYLTRGPPYPNTPPSSNPIPHSTHALNLNP